MCVGMEGKRGEVEGWRGAKEAWAFDCRVLRLRFACAKASEAD